MRRDGRLRDACEANEMPLSAALKNRGDITQPAEFEVPPRESRTQRGRVGQFGMMAQERLRGLPARIVNRNFSLEVDGGKNFNSAVAELILPEIDAAFTGVGPGLAGTLGT